VIYPKGTLLDEAADGRCIEAAGVQSAQHPLAADLRERRAASCGTW